MVKVAAQVNKLVKALPSTESIAQSSSAKGKGRASDQDAIENVARWLSDWHLLAFLNSIFDKVRASTSSDLAISEPVLGGYGVIMQSRNLERPSRGGSFTAIVSLADYACNSDRA